MKFKSAVSLAVGLAALFFVTQAYADPAIGTPTTADVKLNMPTGYKIADSVDLWTGAPAGFTDLFTKDSPSANSGWVTSDPYNGITFSVNVGGTNNPPKGTWDLTWSGNTTDVTVDLYVIMKSGNQTYGFFFQGVTLAAADPQSYLNNLWQVTFYNGNGGPAALNYIDIFVGNMQTPHTDPVPEPATMLLFGTGLLGLAGVARRKKS